MALWLELQQRELKEIYDGDIVIIDEQLHTQFDEFKQKAVPANHMLSMVRMLNLIDHYLSIKGKFCVFNCVELYGKLYIMLNYYLLYDENSQYI